MGDRGGGHPHPARQRGHDVRDPAPGGALRSARGLAGPGRPHRDLGPGVPRHRAAVAHRGRGDHR